MRSSTDPDDDQTYECATCCYSTNSYAKFLSHGLTHVKTEETQLRSTQSQEQLETRKTIAIESIASSLSSLSITMYRLYKQS